MPDAKSLCYATLSVYEDRACGASRRIGAQRVYLGEEGACLPAGEGLGLGSLSAEWDLNQPGSCTPVGGGGPNKVTLCCLPEPDGATAQ
ncbi:hypothetical protein BE21_57615 [Sorangium cellulosum]|uniref:Uncharacterized protein n=1 Tax=Sorangium cellulosum TaxID=56 RepID=A0A150U3H9_SORCE|nr:hypothetical protein BE21_57615 [Sorangium cellulosum]